MISTTGGLLFGCQNIPLVPAPTFLELDANIQPLYLVIARELATLVMDGGFGLYNQWFLGDVNNVADLLLHDTDLTPDTLTP